MSILKPDGKSWTVLEQIIEDPVTELVFQFELSPDGEPRLKVFGDKLRFGNRDFQFNHDGELVGTGTTTSGLCRPTWLTLVEPPDDEEKNEK